MTSLFDPSSVPIPSNSPAWPSKYVARRYLPANLQSFEPSSNPAPRHAVIRVNANNFSPEVLAQLRNHGVNPEQAVASFLQNRFGQDSNDFNNQNQPQAVLRRTFGQESPPINNFFSPIRHPQQPNFHQPGPQYRFPTNIPSRFAPPPSPPRHPAFHFKPNVPEFPKLRIISIPFINSNLKPINVSPSEYDIDVRMDMRSDSEIQANQTKHLQGGPRLIHLGFGNENFDPSQQLPRLEDEDDDDFKPIQRAPDAMNGRKSAQNEGNQNAGDPVEGREGDDNENSENPENEEPKNGNNANAEDKQPVEQLNERVTEQLPTMNDEVPAEDEEAPQQKDNLPQEDDKVSQEKQKTPPEATEDEKTSQEADNDEKDPLMSGQLPVMNQMKENATDSDVTEKATSASTEQPMKSTQSLMNKTDKAMTTAASSTEATAPTTQAEESTTQKAATTTAEVSTATTTPEATTTSATTTTSAETSTISATTTSSAESTTTSAQAVTTTTSTEATTSAATTTTTEATTTSSSASPSTEPTTPQTTSTTMTEKPKESEKVQEPDMTDTTEESRDSESPEMTNPPEEVESETLTQPSIDPSTSDQEAPATASPPIEENTINPGEEEENATSTDSSDVEETTSFFDERIDPNLLKTLAG